MANQATRSKYYPAIGIECHVQLNTRTKLFAAVGNDARGAEPNSLISHICLGMPGALPVLNEKAVWYAIRMAYAFNVKPQKFSYFERKHYFYPDLPKGYQITQLAQPIIKGGYVDIEVDGEAARVRLNRVQLEEDAGKNTHPTGAAYSLVDLNRAGTPLLEIVSEPDMISPAQAKTYARELYLLARFTGVSDADMYHGNMRFDVNVSVSTDKHNLGTRTETKNLNSFRSVEKAVEYEINRQIELLETGRIVAQETRGWDDARQKTVSQRGKEEAHDYRYMPEPDLPPIEIDDGQMDAAAADMPVLPREWRERLRRLGLDGAQVETLLEAEVEHPAISFLGLIETHLDQADYARALANWFVNLEIPLRRDVNAAVQANDNQLRAKLYRAAYDLARAGKLSSTNAKALITTVMNSGAEPRDYEKYAGEQGLIQESDKAAIAKIVATVISENRQAAQDVKAGQTKAIGFLVGQVMKASRGQANPGLARELIKKRLGL